MTRLQHLEVNLYRASLWLYPRDLRRGLGSEMTALFAEALEDAGRRPGCLSVSGLWLSTAQDFVRVALRGHLMNPALVIPLFSAASAVAILGSLDWALLHGPALNRAITQILSGSIR
jgi:hypothetical protein